MNDDNLLGGVLGQLRQTVKQGVKQVVKLPEAQPQEKPGENKPQQQWKSDEERVKFLRGLYGSSETSPETSTFSKASADKQEEQKKLMELRQQLHKQNYYDPTFNPVKKQEECPAEKVENEKKKEMVDLQKKEENKPPPLAVVREQNKTEMFRGQAG